MLLLMVFKVFLKIKWKRRKLEEEIVFLNEKKMPYVFISVTYLVA